MLARQPGELRTARNVPDWKIRFFIGEQELLEFTACLAGERGRLRVFQNDLHVAFVSPIRLHRFLHADNFRI